MTLHDEVSMLQRNLRSALGNKQNGNAIWRVDRNSMIDGLISVAMFFRRVGGFQTYAQQFDEFASVLIDLDYGTVHPILTPKGRQNKPPDPTDIWCARTRIVIAYSMLTEAGWQDDEAVGEIVARCRRTKELAHDGGRNRTPSEAIAGWRRALKKRELKNEEARDLYRTFKHLIVVLKMTKTPGALKRTLVSLARHQLKVVAGFIPMTAETVRHSRNWRDRKRAPSPRAFRQNRPSSERHRAVS